MTNEFPVELKNACKKFDYSMHEVERCLAPILKNDRSKLIRNLSFFDSAKLDLVSLYAMNSFFWAFLVLKGINPKTHPIKEELQRIQACMAKVEEIKNTCDLKPIDEFF